MTSSATFRRFASGKRAGMRAESRFAFPRSPGDSRRTLRIASQVPWSAQWRRCAAGNDRGRRQIRAAPDAEALWRRGNGVRALVHHVSRSRRHRSGSACDSEGPATLPGADGIRLFRVRFGLRCVRASERWLGDWMGPRRVLLRIVLWWSFFTAATGWAWNYGSLVVTRFLFGVGEAGCFPNL